MPTRYYPLPRQSLPSRWSPGRLDRVWPAQRELFARIARNVKGAAVKAVQHRNHGGPEVLEIVVIPDPKMFAGRGRAVPAARATVGACTTAESSRIQKRRLANVLPYLSDHRPSL